MILWPHAPLRGADEAGAAKESETAAEIRSLESRIQRLRESKEIDAELRDELIEKNQEAIEQYRAADEFKSKAADWVKDCETAQADLERVKADLSKASEQPAAARPVDAGANASFAQMQQALARAEADRDHRRQELEELTDESDRRAERRQEIAEREEEIEQELRDIQESLDKEPDENEDRAEAELSLLHARREALHQEQEMHRQELFAFDATAELVSAQRDLAATRLQAAEDLFDAWQKVVNDFRRSEADRELAEAQQQVEKVHPALRQIAETNVALATVRRDIAVRIEETIADSESASERLEELEEQFEKVTARAKKIGFTEAIGLLLRKQRDTLSVIDESLRNKRVRAASVSQMSVLLSDYEEQRARLADLKSRVRLEMAGLRPSIPAAQVESAERDLRDLLENQRSCLDALIRDTTRYVDELMELETIERQLVACVREFGDFSHEHSLWIRSTGFPRVGDEKRLAESARWMVDPSHWAKAGRLLADDARAHAGLYVAIGALVAGMALGVRRFRRRLSSNLQLALTPDLFSIVGKLTATLLSAGLWAAVVVFIGRRLSGSAPDEFVTALGRSLTAVSPIGFGWACLYGLLGERWVAADLFSWDGRRIAETRRALVRAGLLGLPLTFIVLLTEAQLSEVARTTLGRLAFVVLMLVGAGTARRIARTMRSVDRLTGNQSAAQEVWGVRGVAIAAIAAPLLLAAASIFGYHYTAVQIAGRLAETALLVVCVAMLKAGFARWMGIGEPVESVAGGENGASPGAGGEESPATLSVSLSSEAPPKRAGVPTQLERLIRLAAVLLVLGGSVAIWSGVFPALKYLRSVEVWPEPFAAVDPELSAEDAAKIVTAAGLLTAVCIAALTLAVVRNLSAGLQLTLFRRVTLDTGARYAVTAIGRYVVALAGLFSACAQLGIGWAQLNWLVAAMTVGLGFGLQEIFANFVSGLILLFERPVRIGDIVSVEGITGTVSRIRIRATTITDGDMRELIVPNKELITGRVINWTLSNTVARMTISVRTAHGVDPDKTRNLLLSLAAQHPLVLKQPPPQAMFDELADKTQNFTLRVFMANCDVYPQLRHELLTSIQRSFRQAGISLSSSDAASLPIPVNPHEQRAA